MAMNGLSISKEGKKVILKNSRLPIHLKKPTKMKEMKSRSQ